MHLLDNDYVLSILLGIIEGLTEFLPVSSTAHLRLAQDLFGLPLDDPYWKMYAVVIQMGAILSVVVYFRDRIMTFLRTFPRGTTGDRSALTHPLTLVILAFFVTAIPSYLASKLIKENLGSLWVIGGALVVGGVVMWLVDWLYGAGGEGQSDRPAPVAVGTEAPRELDYTHTGPRKAKTPTMDQIRPLQAIWIGAAQVLAAVFPGTSRSMSTIAAGQVVGLSRPAALEFSFFISIPTMLAATSYDLLQTITAGPDEPELYIAGGISGHQWGVLLVGLLVSFFVAWGVIAWFMAWVRRRGFVPFAIWRIVVGSLVLMAAAGTF